MIVKNESKIIERCLDAAQWVDGFFISDTGSTDDTPEVIERWASKHKKIGVVVKNQWKNFGYNRTEAILQAKKWCRENDMDLEKTYLLFLDADMVFSGESIRNIVHTADLWDVNQQNPSVVYANLRVARASLEIECKCPTHEYYDITTPNVVRKLFTGASINDIGDGGSKSDKVPRDIKMLEEALITDPNNCRYWFYLANTYRDNRDYEAAIKAYNRRVEIGGWFEETYCALLYKGDCHYVLKQYPEAIDSWLKAYNVDHHRGEALSRLSIYYRSISKHYTAMLFIDKGLKLPLPQDRQLFVEKHVYDYRFYYELSICAYYTGEIDRGMMACSLVLKNPNVPVDLVETTKNNMRFYETKK